MSASRQKPQSGSPEDEPLTGRQPVNPPQPNPIGLVISGTLLLGWMGVLIWLAIQSLA